MRIKKRSLALLTAIIAVISLVSCAAGTFNEGTVEHVSISVISDDAESNEASYEENGEIESAAEISENTDNTGGSAGETKDTANETYPAINENGTYTSKEDVALYIITYGALPSNFITKKKAQSLGWSGGSLEPYAPGKCIGGDRFGNYEGLLPEAAGRTYTECDIDTLGKNSRGAKRIVFSDDGLIYYTDDHYESFTLIYGGVEP